MRINRRIATVTGTLVLALATAGFIAPASHAARADLNDCVIYLDTQGVWSEEAETACMVGATGNFQVCNTIMIQDNIPPAIAGEACRRAAA